LHTGSESSRQLMQSTTLMACESECSSCTPSVTAEDLNPCTCANQDSASSPSRQGSYVVFSGTGRVEHHTRTLFCVCVCWARAMSNSCRDLRSDKLRSSYTRMSIFFCVFSWFRCCFLASFRCYLRTEGVSSCPARTLSRRALSVRARLDQSLLHPAEKETIVAFGDQPRASPITTLITGCELLHLFWMLI
jgi:hypothetical protein